MTKKESAKERILGVASELFYTEGIRAVGIDRIIAESGVAKASFYRNFATKDDLVVAFLEQRQLRSLSKIEEARKLYPEEPVKQLHFLVKVLSASIRQPEFRGCPFTNTLLEFPDSAHPGHRTALQCRVDHETEVSEIARQAKARNPEALAAQLEMLYGGAIVDAYIRKPSSDNDNFYNAAMVLIESQLT
ncbi:TetR/AcrR family transcriptional regulator [Paenibacillus pasadenensis]|uniref:TetR/AcrR family transcriptional regulator n=1 Tax=Paenibacillus pasadenensis TaxID=217090 RepID=UPI00203D15B5|nr:TetR/AcrR family transcriptional regulator [Paenibacillus pasadenensis]MCM3748625.1 TetR/AcrR family transcriptional regulator [Paenibacillus pasadenensis]